MRRHLSCQHSAVSFQLQSLCDLCDYFAAFAFKTVSLKRKERKEDAKVAKNFLWLNAEC